MRVREATIVAEVGGARVTVSIEDGDLTVDRFLAEIGKELRRFKTTPGACDDPKCPVLHEDPTNPVHPPS